MFPDFILVVLIFFTGILFFSALSKKIGISLNFLEKIVYGSILWSYLLISPSIILGITTHSITAYFYIFIITSILVIIFSAAYLIINREKPTIKAVIKTKVENLAFTLIFLALLSLSLLAIYFHTFYIEWDAIAYYIPSAKAVLTTGGLTYQPYYSLDFFPEPPAVPITYALPLNFSNLNSLYYLPIVYFLLTVITVYLLAEKLFPKNYAIISPLVFMSLPDVIILIGSRSLYLDLPFLLYLLFTLYCVIKISTTQVTQSSLLLDYIMFSIGFTLLVLTRYEFAVLLAPALFASFAVLFRPKGWKLICTSMIGLTYYIREIRNIVLNPSSASYYFQRLLPALILSILFFIIITSIRHEKYSYHVNRILTKSFGVFIPTLPLLTHMFYQVVILGWVIPGIPLLNNEINKNILNSSLFFRSINPASAISESLSGMLRWDYFVSVWWLIPPYLLPIVISLISSFFGLLKRKSAQSSVMLVLIFFVSIFTLWSVILSCDPQPRRLYYFAPFIALLVTHGLFTIKRFYSPFGLAIRIPTYVTAVTTYTLTKMGIKKINDIPLLYAKLYQPTTDIELTVTAAFIFLIIFVPYETLLKKSKNLASPKKSALVILSMVCVNILLISSWLTPIFIDVVNNGDHSRYAYYGGWEYYPDVVNYYKENVTDSFVTMGFYCRELITLANRPIIDLSNPLYGMPIYSMIATANETEMFNKMKELDIKYFLRPEENSPFFPLYEKLVTTTILSNILVDNPRLRLLATFKHATLYEFHENYIVTPLAPSTIQPWNYNPEENYRVTIEHNRTKLTATTNTYGRLSLMYIFKQPQTIKEALWLSVKSYNQSKLIVMLFTNLKNRTTDFFTYQSPLTNQTTRKLINLKEGRIRGNFNSNHVEGILIGIEAPPNTTQTFEIYELSTITYEEQAKR